MCVCYVGGNGVDVISGKMLLFHKSVYAIKLAIQKNKIFAAFLMALAHNHVYIYIADILSNINGTLQRQICGYRYMYVYVIQYIMRSKYFSSRVRMELFLRYRTFD